HALRGEMRDVLRRRRIAGTVRIVLLGEPSRARPVRLERVQLRQHLLRESGRCLHRCCARRRLGNVRPHQVARKPGGGQAYSARSLRTAAAEFPTLSTARCSFSLETPSAWVQYLTSQASCMLILLRSGCSRFVRWSIATSSSSQKNATIARPFRNGPPARCLRA